MTAHPVPPLPVVGRRPVRPRPVLSREVPSPWRSPASCSPGLTISPPRNARPSQDYWRRVVPPRRTRDRRNTCIPPPGRRTAAHRLRRRPQPACLRRANPLSASTAARHVGQSAEHTDVPAAAVLVADGKPPTTVRPRHQRRLSAVEHRPGEMERITVSVRGRGRLWAAAPWLGHTHARRGRRVRVGCRLRRGRRRVRVPR